MKLGIITSEGGMSCAYSVGVILALIERYGIKSPYIVIGSSGSSNTLAYYVAGQYDSIRNIWSNLLSTARFISLKRPWKVLDIDYLIDEVFKKQDPLDIPKVVQSRIKFLIPATDRSSGKVMYFANNGSVDILEALRASSAASGLYGRSVVIDGQEYVDGAPSAPFSKNIAKAKLEGADKIIAICNSNDDFISRSFLRICAFFQNKNLRKTIFEYCASDTLEPDPNVLLIKPSKKVPAKTLDNKRADIIATIELGYKDALNSPIETFLEQPEINPPPLKTALALNYLAADSR